MNVFGYKLSDGFVRSRHLCVCVCVCMYQLLVCLICLVYSCGNFLKVMDAARFGENCLSAYIKTVFSPDSLSCGLKSINVAFCLQGLLSVLSSDIKVTSNCPSSTESWKNSNDSQVLVKCY